MAALACVEAIDNSHLDVARARCSEAVTQDQSLGVAHLWLSQVAATPQQAVGELRLAGDRVASASPGERLLIEAWRMWREARIADATASYDELVRLLPGEKRAFLARGQFRQAGGDLDGAIADYKQALALDGKYAVAHNFLGFAEADAGRLDDAIADVKRYGEMAPAEANAHDSLAQGAAGRPALAAVGGPQYKAVAPQRAAHCLAGDPPILGVGEADAG